MKTIRGKILLPVILIVSISLLVLGGVSIYLNVASTNSTLEQTMTQTAQLGAERVSQELQRYSNIAAETGATASLSDPDSTLSQKRALIDAKADMYGFQRGEIILPTGRGLLTGNSYADRDYFQAAMQGDTFISEPLVSKVTGELTVIVCAPLWENGIANTKIVGAVYFVPQETFLNDIVGQIKVSENGSAYMLSSQGITIAHRDITLVEQQSNTSEDAKTDAALLPLVALEQKMTAGEAGFGTYTYGGEKKFLAYAPVAQTNGWSLAINAPVNDFMAETIMSVFLTAILLVVALAVAVFIAAALAKRIATPVQAVQHAAAQMAQGDLHIDISSRDKDEVGQMTNSFAQAAQMLRAYIVDISRRLQAMADGNFDVYGTEDFKGDFKAIDDAIEGIAVSLNATLGDINESSGQVSAGADQVSGGAQALSQGATEQASAVEELAATITEISEQVKSTAENARNASERVLAVGGEVDASNEQMQQLIAAMQDIDRRSSEIGKIIKTIEDIAFQTNILALNAAVEAARAGAAGKGFAVVADEVRNLASKSAEAAKNTTLLIEGSMQAVKRGTGLAGETATGLSHVVEGAKSVVDIVDKISQATGQQATSIAQVSSGVDQISSVVQTNSATAEQSAAASEELSGQANILKGLVSKFNLRGQDTAAWSTSSAQKPTQAVLTQSNAAEKY